MDRPPRVHTPLVRSLPAPPSRDAPLPLSVLQSPWPFVHSGAADALLFCGVTEGVATATVDDIPLPTLAAPIGLVVTGTLPLTVDAPLPASSSPIVVTLEVDRASLHSVLAQLAVPVRPGSAPAPDDTHTHFPLSPSLHHLVQTAAHWTQADPATDAARRHLTAAQLLLALLETPARTLLHRLMDGANVPPGITDALRYIRRHLHRPLSVDALAERACMSRSTFYRHFRTAVGRSPLQYITRLRIERAQHLLRDPTRTVTGVSLDLGFRSVSHFIDTFRRHTGTTPKSYSTGMSDVCL